MGLLEKATKYSDRNVSVNTAKEKVLGDAEISLSSPESERTVDGYVKEDSESDEGKGGLLLKAEALKESAKETVNEEKGGLLSKAEEVLKKETEIAVEGSKTESSGLMEKAEELLKETVEEKEEVGLLEKAQKFVTGEEEMQVSEVSEIAKLEGEERVEIKKEETFEKIPLEEEEGIFSEEIFSAGKMIEEEATKIEREIQEETPEIEYEEKEGKKEIEEETTVADYFSILKKSLLSGESEEVMKIMDSILSEEGFNKLGELVLDILISMTGGEAGAIYTLYDTGFKPTIFASSVDQELKKRYRILKTKIKKSEKLTTALLNLQGPILSKDKKATPIYESIKNIDKIKSWLLVPFISHAIIYGFAFIINVNEKKRFTRKTIKLIMMMFKDKLAIEILENRIIENEKELTVFKESQKYVEAVKKSLLKNKVNIDLAFDKLCSSISVDMASLVITMQNYEEVIALKGVSQESSVRYNTSKVRAKIKSYINKGKIVLAGDIKSEQFGLVGEDSKKADTLVLVPILYQNEPCGVLIIHKFSYKVKKMTPELISKLSSLSEYLLPVLLDYRLKRMNPVDSIIEKIDDTIRWSGKAKKKVQFFNIKLKKVYESIEKAGIKRFIAFYGGIRKTAKEVVSDMGEVIYLSPEKIVVIIKEGKIDIDEFKARLEENLIEFVKKQKLFNDISFKIDISTYPDEIKSFTDVFKFFSYNH